jgi:hypothetical protein
MDLMSIRLVKIDKKIQLYTGLSEFVIDFPRMYSPFHDCKGPEGYRLKGVRRQLTVSFRDEGKQQEDFRATQHLLFSHIAILLREMFPDHPSINLQPGIKHNMNGDFPDQMRLKFNSGMVPFLFNYNQSNVSSGDEETFPIEQVDVMPSATLELWEYEEKFWPVYKMTHCVVFPDHDSNSDAWNPVTDLKINKQFF